MVLGWKGPKAILSSAIANALAEYFVVDAKSIESNLLKDTKIVLFHVLLRKQVMRLDKNSAGTPTLITITGSVQQVEFKWTWAVGSNRDEQNLDAWVKDSSLTLKGLDFKAKLEYGTGEEELTSSQQQEQSAADDTILDKQDAAAIQKQGGFQAWIGNQVQMIIDSLVLNVDVFAFSVEIPPPLMEPTKGMDLQQAGEMTSIVVGGSKVTLAPIDTTNVPTSMSPPSIQSASKALDTTSTSMEPPTVITQRISIESFYVNVIMETIVSLASDGGTTSSTSTSSRNSSTRSRSLLVRVLEPFTYSAKVTRSGGKRFGSVGTGLTVVGEIAEPAADETSKEGDDNDKSKFNDSGSLSSSDLVLRAGTAQFEAFTQLGVMILAPPNDDDNEDRKKAATADNGSMLLSASAAQGTNAPYAASKQDTDQEEDAKANVVGSYGDPKLEQKGNADVPRQPHDDIVSVFIFPIKSVSLLLEDTAKMTVSSLALTYQADGTMMGTTAEGIRFESIDMDKAETKGASLSATGINVQLRPKIEFVISEIEELVVPGVFCLARPIEDPRISFEGKTLSIAMDRIEGEALMTRVQESQDDTPAASCATDSRTTLESLSLSSSVAEASSSMTAANSTLKRDSRHDAHADEEDLSSRESLPFPCSISIKDIVVKTSEDGLVKVNAFDLYLNPEPSTNSTDVAVRFCEFKNELLQLKKVNSFASLPLENVNEIGSFKFSAESGQVCAGYSSKDWQNSFCLPAMRRAARPANRSSVPKLPFASVSHLKLTISWKGSAVSVKDTRVAIKPFQGDADTTSKDLVNYYVGACVSRAPGFISNAEVLGLNVVDNTASTWGAWVGIGSMGTMGAGGGLAAIAAVDSVKGAVAAGKRSRRVDEGDSWKPGDGIRGIIYSVGEATRSGAVKRGKSDEMGNVSGEVADFAVGVGTATGKYVGENKSKLGAATGAGVGMVVGTMVGGPIGGIIGGVLASAATGKAIDSAEGRDKKKSAQKIEADGSNKKNEKK